MNQIRKVLFIIGITVVVIIAALFLLRMYTKSFSPATKASFSENNLEIEVIYCQPSKKGRQIFGNIVPFGQVWRTGANEATEITFKTDVLFGGKELKAGRYALFTIPNKEFWTVILNSKLGQWGAFNYNEKEDVLRVDVPVMSNEKVIEKFSIRFIPAAKGGSEMELAWDTTKILVPIQKAK